MVGPASAGPTRNSPRRTVLILLCGRVITDLRGAQRCLSPVGFFLSTAGQRLSGGVTCPVFPKSSARLPLWDAHRCSRRTSYELLNGNVNGNVNGPSFLRVIWGVG